MKICPHSIIQLIGTTSIVVVSEALKTLRFKLIQCSNLLATFWKASNKKPSEAFQNGDNKCCTIYWHSSGYYIYLFIYLTRILNLCQYVFTQQAVSTLIIILAWLGWLTHSYRLELLNRHSQFSDETLQIKTLNMIWLKRLSPNKCLKYVNSIRFIHSKRSENSFILSLLRLTRVVLIFHRNSNAVMQTKNLIQIVWKLDCN